MSIQPDIKKAIEIIDQRIESLRQIRASLAKEFGMDELVRPAGEVKPENRSQILLPVPFQPKKTSKDNIAEFLRLRGPASRGEIAAATGIPDGTVSYALNDKDRFRRTEQGWTNVTSETISVTVDPNNNVH